MHRTVATAGKDDLRPGAHRLAGLARCGAGSFGVDHFDAMAQRRKRLRNLTYLLGAAMPQTARGGVAEKDAVHRTILRSESSFKKSNHRSFAALRMTMHFLTHISASRN
jgi:hypothetical protein